MSDEKKSEEQGDETVTARPAVGTYNSYENELLTVLHLLKYNLHLNAKATVFAAILQGIVVNSKEEAVQLTQEAIQQMRELDGLK